MSAETEDILLPQDDPEVAPLRRALGISFLALVVAALVSLAWPSSVDEYAGLIWVLALIPLFLLSYHRGWKGTAAASATAMVAFTLSEVVVRQLLAQPVDWRLYAVATVVLLVVTVGTAWVTEMLHRKRHEALELAHEDPLTKLANRRHLRQETRGALARAERDGSNAGMLFIDLVRFKRINDNLGHEAGDRVLLELADRLRGSVRTSDTVARVGGDEFAVLLSTLDGVDDAVAAAERVASCFDEPFASPGKPIRLKARIGVAVYPQHAKDYHELLAHSDRAMYPLDRHAESRIAIFDPAGGEESERPELESKLREALRTGDLALHYQPIFHLPDGRVGGAEALVRWPDPEGWVMGADEFLPAAERAGLMTAVDEWTLTTAVEHLEAWPGAAAPGWISVNLAERTFWSPGLPDRLASLLSGTGVDRSRLILEVTEETATQDPAASGERLAALRGLGVRIALQDFGTSHTSLAYLEHFPADFLKLDMMFVDAIGSGSRKERLVEALIALGQSLGMEIIAEGVEAAEQLAWLRETRCDFAQGFHLGRPGAADELDMEPLVVTTSASE
ncbi:MAG: putative bifunctional diguanylate cyclase/phosphodiesterase [Gemmatimonadota bacterium]